MAFEWHCGSGLASAIITILIATAFLYFAARFVLERSSFVASLLTASVATLLRTLVAGPLANVIETQWVVLVMGVKVWALVAAIFFRAKWAQGAVIGFARWLLWFLENLAMAARFGG